MGLVIKIIVGVVFFSALAGFVYLTMRALVTGVIPDDAFDFWPEDDDDTW
jgi:hypothetical protein